MKTLTEFAGSNLKNAAKVKQDLTASGKTPEELPIAIGESLKLEGERLTFLTQSLDLVQNKFQDLKRVVVFTLSENEKPPAKSVQKGEHYYLLDYYPSLTENKERRSVASDGRGDNKKKGNRGKEDRSQQRKPSRPNRTDSGQPRADTQPQLGIVREAGAAIVINEARPRRAPRGPSRNPRSPAPNGSANSPKTSGVITPQNGAPIILGPPKKIVIKPLLEPKTEAPSPTPAEEVQVAPKL